MSEATRGEIILLGFAVALVAWLSPRLPGALEPGELAALAALTLLVQGGIRDVVFIVREKRARAAGVARAGNEEEAHCMCLESTVGLSGVFAGVLLTALLHGGPEVELPGWFWPAALALIGVCGLTMRDVVIQWKPRLRFRRVRDHGSILVRFSPRR